MAYSINQVLLIGYVGSTPEVKEVKATDKQGLPVTIKVSQFRLATSKGGGKDKDGGEIPSVTQWHNIVAWRRLADMVIAKGDKLCVMGEIQYREYEKDGQKRYVTDIVATEIFPISREPKAETPQVVDIPSGLPF